MQSAESPAVLSPAFQDFFSKITNPFFHSPSNFSFLLYYIRQSAISGRHTIPCAFRFINPLQFFSKNFRRISFGSSLLQKAACQICSGFPVFSLTSSCLPLVREPPSGQSAGLPLLSAKPCPGYPAAAAFLPSAFAQFPTNRLQIFPQFPAEIELFILLEKLLQPDRTLRQICTPNIDRLRRKRFLQ